MSTRLWDKGKASDAEMLRYTSRDDWQLDQRLLPYDLRATRAHAAGLGRCGVLTEAEVTRLLTALDTLDAREARGELRLTEQDEDGHSLIEQCLVELVGDLGKKVHTGRSRNDQVLVAMRLYERDALSAISEASRAAGRAMLAVARQHERVPLPGYTHLQRAMPSSVGHWAACFAEGFGESAALIDAVGQWLNRSPLGAAAGYGVNLPLDRDGVARELGFQGLQVNPQWSQTSRGLLEAQVLSACFQPMAVTRRLAWDLSLFTTSEFGFVRLPDEFTTGSSIMPQKRNPDVVELMRAACSVVQGALAEVQTLVALPSAYHRDLQLTKGPVFRALDETLATLGLVPRLAGGLRFDTEAMRAATTPETFATDRAVELALAGMPFRDAYRQVAAEVLGGGGGGLATRTPEESLAARVSPGAPGALELGRIEAGLNAAKVSRS
jgi:argininosuccinate lyase